MPTGPFLYADQLIGTLRNKSASKCALCAPCLRRFQAHDRRRYCRNLVYYKQWHSRAMFCSGYAEMVLYIEACESGSIFQGMLDETTPNVWATTAANAEESSWGTCAACMLLSPSFSVKSHRLAIAYCSQSICARLSLSLLHVSLQTARASFLVRRPSSILAWVTCTLCRGWRTAMSGAVLRW